MNLHYWEKQLILYTKGHFGRTDYIKDLKYFPSELYGLSIERTDNYNVFGMVVRLYQKLVDHKYIPFTLERFIGDTFRRTYRENGKNEVSYDDVLRQMLAEIQGIAVMENGVRILELGKPYEKLKDKIKLEMESVIE